MKYKGLFRLIVLVSILVMTAGTVEDRSQASKAPIILGFALAKSGLLAPYDLEPGQAAVLRAQEINAHGGVLGRPLKVIWENTQSDKALAATVADDLISKGASLIVATCDFDFGSPAAIEAQRKNLPSISICASDPKFSDKVTIGPDAFSMAPGSDDEAAADAEWAYKVKGWRTAYILQDQSLEYTKALGRYFKARWTQLGGKIVGEDSFPGGENVTVTAQASRIRSLSHRPDFIYLPTWEPGGASAIRGIRSTGISAPILGPSALDPGTLMTQIAGSISNVYFNPYGCYVYCTGQNNPSLMQFAKAYKQKYGRYPSSAYDLDGYAMVTVIAEAMQKARSTQSSALLKAFESLPTLTGPLGTVQFFSSTCHRPIRESLAFVQVQNGKFRYLGNFRPAKIPSIGDGNPCATK